MTKFFESLSRNFAQLLENGDDYNIIFHVGEGMVKQSFKAHSAVLQFRCPHLYNELKSIPYNGNFKEISKFHTSAEVFEILI
ncbi:16279_t:CDS:1, partial [Dentiscutata heterogama]